MSRLYLVRHGQTAFNLHRLVQGRCDSPLTPLGRAQARVAGRWYHEHGVRFDHAYSSPAGRACDTLELIRATQVELEMAPLLKRAGVDAGTFAELARAYDVARTGAPAAAPYARLAGLAEHDYGSLEARPWDELPASPWTPGDAMVPFGGESQEASEQRISRTLQDVMSRPGHERVLAVAHGCVAAGFRRVWGAHARCNQDVPLDNCCILVFDFDPRTRAFSNVETVNHDFSSIEERP